MERRYQCASYAIFYRVRSLVFQGAGIVRPFYYSFFSNAIFRELLSVIAERVDGWSVGPSACLVFVLIFRLSLAVSHPTWRPTKVLTTSSATNCGVSNTEIAFTGIYSVEGSLIVRDYGYYEFPIYLKGIKARFFQVSRK